MTFLYRSGPTASEQRLKETWTLITSGAASLQFVAKPDLCVAEIKANHLFSGTLGPAWIVVDGYPKVPQGPFTEADALTALAIDIVEGWNALSRWRGAFTALLVVPDIELTMCVRDPIGARTLYYQRSPRSIAVSSSAYFLASTRTVITEDRGFLAAMFALRAERPPGRTAFNGVSELLPGQILSHQNDAFRVKRNPNRLPRVYRGPPDKLAGAFSARFRSAIDHAVPPDGPAAIMLSGGLDSAPSACVAASLMSSKGQRLHAISWKLPDFPECDETRWIRTVARHANIALHEFDGGKHPAFGILDSSASNPDYPAYNAFRPLFNECYRIASDLAIPVLLNAHAGDLIYPHREMELVDLFRRRELRRLTASITREIARSPRRVHQNRALRGLASHLLGRSSGTPNAPVWLSPDASSDFELLDFADWLPEAKAHAAPSYCRRLLGLGIQGGVQYEVQMSREYGIARRDPFYDLDLLLFMLSIPPWMQLHDTQDKWLMREAMRGVLPESVRTKGKTGLLYSFFRAGFQQQLPKIRELLMDSPDWSRWVDREFVETALSPDSSDRQMMVVNACLGYVLWRERIQQSPFESRAQAT